MKNKEKEMKKRLFKLQKEINSLEFKINHPKINKLKKSFVKNLKITSKVAILVAPYVLCAGIFAATMPAIGWGRPFVKDDEVHTYANIMTEYTSYGETRIEKQYNYLASDDNVISYYSKWEEKDNGKHVREIKTYKIKEITEEEAIKILNQEKIELVDIIEDVKSIVEEEKSKLSEEELEQGEFYQITLYSKDKKDTTFRIETKNENSMLSMLYLIISGVTGLGLDFIRRVCTGFNYSKSVELIKDNYKEDDIEELKQKLELKLSNYNRLMR